jgi:tRNA pseudouridine38/39 synthase
MFSHQTEKSPNRKITIHKTQHLLSSIRRHTFSFVLIYHRACQVDAMEKYHPILHELHLINFPGGKNTKTTISSLEILQHLLESKVVTPKAIRSAHQAILDSKTNTSKKNKDETTNTPPQQDNNTVPSVPTTPAPAYRTRHIALRFYYNGANYTGLAQNIGQENDNSVERALYQALIKTKLVQSRETSGYSRCGRTDKGVSAAGQLVALQLKSTIPLDASWEEDGKATLSEEELPKNSMDRLRAWVLPKLKKKKKQQLKPDDDDGNDTTTTSTVRQEKQLTEYDYAKILNNVLPDDIRILGWSPVSTDFSARFSCTTRTYRYFFVQRQMDLEKIRQGLERLVGKHDFRNFCKMDVEKVYNFERIIHSAQVIQLKEYGVCYLQIVGQAFLWHQIRCIAHILFLVGQGLESPDIVTELLNVENLPGKPSYPLAPERPLVLHNCGYPNLRVGYSVQNVWSVSCQLEQQWEELILAAARVRNCIDSMTTVPVLKEDLVEFVTTKSQERQKKRQRYYSGENRNNAFDVGSGPDSEDSNMTSTTSAWEEALPWLKERGLVPDSNGLNNAIHVPMLQRSKGTTYEEKIAALQNSGKRRQKYEDNVIKKRKTKEEDHAFYEHMAKQGGAGI